MGDGPSVGCLPRLLFLEVLLRFTKCTGPTGSLQFTEKRVLCSIAHSYRNNSTTVRMQNF